MKILSITYEYPPIGGGGGAMAAALNEQLARQGNTVSVLTSRMRGQARFERVGAVDVHRTWCWRRHRHYTTALELSTTLMPAWQEGCRMIEALRPHILHTHFVLPSGIVAWQLARRFNLPYVITAHGSDIPEYNPDRFILLHRLLKPLWRQIVANAAMLVSPSEFLAGLIRRQVQLPIRIIPNGYSPATSLGQRKRKLVLVVARLFPRKGVQRFIESVAGMGTDWEYVIAGDGPYLPHLQALSRELNVPVRFVGFVDAHTLRGYYEEAQILVFPSLRENFPMVLLEAMDAGCAIITTDAQGCGEVVGEAGMVVKKDNAQQLRTALMALMRDPARCAALGRAAQERVELFRWPHIAGLYQDTFAAAVQTDPLTDTAVQRRLVI